MSEQVSEEFIRTLNILNSRTLDNTQLNNLNNLITDDRLIFYKDNIMNNNKIDYYLKLCFYLIRFDNDDILYFELNYNNYPYLIKNFRLSLFIDEKTNSSKFFNTLINLKYLIYDCNIYDDQQKLKLLLESFAINDTKNLYYHMTLFNSNVENLQKIEEIINMFDDEHTKKFVIDNLERFFIISKNFLYSKDIHNTAFTFPYNLKTITLDYLNKNNQIIRDKLMSPIEIFENILNIPKNQRLPNLDYENIITTEYLENIINGDETNLMLFDILLKKNKFEKIQKIINNIQITNDKDNNCTDFFNKNKDDPSFNNNCCVDIDYNQCTKFKKYYDENRNYCICDDNPNKNYYEQINMKKKYLKYKMKYLILKKKYLTISI